MRNLNIIVAVALTGLLFSLTALPAGACMNAIAREHERAEPKAGHTDGKSAQDRVPKDAKVIDAATDDLNAGRNREAIVRLYEHFGFSINQWAVNAENVGAPQHEVVYIVAIAVLRTEGAVERYFEYKPSSAKRKKDNVAWAVRAMEGLAFEGFAAERHIAEAWGRDPSLKNAAVEKLLRLNNEGLLLSRFQVSLLARLLREQGRAAEADAILTPT